MHRLNRKSNFFLLLLSFIVIPAFSQSRKAVVIDRQTGEPVPYAYICLESLDKKIAVNRITDEKGSAQIEVKGKMQVAVSSVGYTTLLDTIDSGSGLRFILEPSASSLSEVVVTGQMTPQRADKSIYNVKVIPRLEIEERAVQNLQELLSTELSVRPTQDNMLGSGLSIQGLTGENVKILIDGVPVIGRQNGILDLSQINLSNIDHIEMIEGPMSVIYGSNALAGAVNLISKDNSRSKYTASANGYYESVGVYNFSGSASANMGRSMISYSGGRNFFAGYSPIDSGRYMLWKPKEQYNSDLLYQYNHGNVKLNAEAVLFSEQLRNNGNLLPDFNYEKAFDEYHFTRRYDLKSAGTVKTGENKGTINYTAAWSEYDKIKRTYLKNLVDLTKILASDPAMHDTSTIRSVVLRGWYSSRPSTTLTWQTGFDINLESGTGKRMDGGKEIDDYAAFISMKYNPAENLSIQPGLRAVYNTKYNAPLIMAVSFKWDPARKLNIRLSAGNGFRSPSLKELYLDFRDSNHNVTGNPDLQAERSFNLNGSADWATDIGKSNLSFELKSYYNRISNRIDLLYDPLDPTGAKYMNIPGNNFVTQGGSLKFQYKLHPRFRFEAGLSIEGKSKLLDFSSFYYTKNFISSFNYKNIKYKFNISMYLKHAGVYKDYRGEFTTDNTLSAVKEVRMDDYNLMDLTLSRPFFRERLNIATGVKNIFNVKNVYSVGGGSSVHGSDASGEASVGWGRTVFLQITYSLRKI